MAFAGEQAEDGKIDTELSGVESADFPAFDALPGSMFGGDAGDAFQFMMDDAGALDLGELDLGSLSLENADEDSDEEDGVDLLSALGFGTPADAATPVPAASPAPAPQPPQGTAAGEAAGQQPAPAPPMDAHAQLMAMQPHMRGAVLGLMQQHIAHLTTTYQRSGAAQQPWLPSSKALAHQLQHFHYWFRAIQMGHPIPPQFVPPQMAAPHYATLYAAEAARVRSAAPAPQGQAVDQAQAAQATQAQPTQAQPAQAQPTQAQPTQAQRTQAQPAQVQAQPAQAQPAQAQGAVMDPHVAARDRRIAELHQRSMGGAPMRVLRELKPSSRMRTSDIVNTVKRISRVADLINPFADDYYATLLARKRGQRPTGAIPQPAGAGGQEVAQLIGGSARQLSRGEAVGAFVSISRASRQRARREDEAADRLRRARRRAAGEDDEDANAETERSDADASVFRREGRSEASRVHRERDWLRIRGVLGRTQRSSLYHPQRSLDLTTGAAAEGEEEAAAPEACSSLVKDKNAVAVAAAETGLSAVVRLEAHFMGEKLGAGDAEVLADAVAASLGSGKPRREATAFLQVLSQTRKGKRLVARGLPLLGGAGLEAVLPLMIESLLFVVCSAQLSEETDKLNAECSNALVDAFSVRRDGRTRVSPALFAACLRTFVETQTKDSVNTVLTFGPSADVMEALLSTGKVMCTGSGAPAELATQWADSMSEVRRLARPTA